MSRELVVLLNSEPVGVLRQTKTDQLEVHYDTSWQDCVDAYPLSLSLPLSRTTHPDSVVRPFVAGLLPDNEAVLDAWARQFHVSPRNPFALLAHMGEDCAGAVQFVPPERLDAFLNDAASDVEWLTEAEVGQRLRDLIERHGTGRRLDDPGYFSLAGAQPKSAMLLDNGRWGIPSGRVATTHILKPPAQHGFSDFAANEHYCLALARALGLSVARSSVKTFDGQEAIVVERYDRLRDPAGRLVRIHQEDACQALAIPPWRKYEAEDGPGAPGLVKLLIDATDDPDRYVAAFIDALALNWAIAGTDAHAKNYSLLIQPGSVQLAPLYDIVSVLAYPKMVPYRKAKLAMRIGREYHIWKVVGPNWRDLARRCRLDEDPVVARVGEVLAAVPAAAVVAAEAVETEGLHSEIIERLRASISRHAERCIRHLERGT